MAQLRINTGTSAGAGDGDSLHTAFNKVNANFTELYTNGIADYIDFAFSVGADDSTLREISNDESIRFIGGTNISTSSDVEGNITITNDFTQDFAYASLTGTPTIPSDVADLTDNTNLLGGSSSGNIQIGADDSSIRTLNNGESFLIRGAQNVTTSSDDEGNIIVNGPDLSTYLQDGDSFDVRGSVFADDSTLLVDGVSGTIPSANLQGDLPDAVTIDGTAIKRKINTISTALAVGLS